MNFRIGLILLLINAANAFRPVAFAQLERRWEPVKNSSGIQIYTRSSDSSEVKEIKMQLTLNAPLATTVQFLGSVNDYTDWVYKCDHAERLISLESGALDYYITLDFPFPFSDRDLAVHSRSWIDSTTGAYHARSVASPEQVPLRKDHVRITEFRSSWVVTPLADEQVTIDYEAASSPGGDIPIWLVNLAIAHGPFETMYRFKELIESGGSFPTSKAGF